MKTKFIFLLLIFIQFSLLAQDKNLSLVSTAGETFSNQNTVISWSLGEISINTLYSDETILTQGFQQTGLFFTATIDSELLINMKVYPVPAKDFISLDIGQNTFSSTGYIIIDINGTIFKKGHFEQNIQKIDIRQLSAGMYFIALKNNTSILLTELKFNKID